MRIYISGPMTGIPDHNRAAFDAANLVFAFCFLNYIKNDDKEEK